MRKTTIARIATQTIDTLPYEVRQWVIAECSIVVNDLSTWDIKPSRHKKHGQDLLGIFGFDNDKPVIGLNHKALRTEQEVIDITKHEIAHAYRWHLGLPDGERAANQLVKEWNTEKEI